VSTYLALSQDYRTECGIGGSGPASVVSPGSRELERAVANVANAWTEIQNEQPNWRWMRGNWTLQTTASDGIYAYGDVTDADTSTAIDRFARWWDEEAQIYLTSAGVGTQRHLTFVPWYIFRQTWLLGSVNTGAPVEWSIDPQNRLRLGPAPDAIYTVTGEYQKSAQTLAADADTPEMPARFHRMIVGKAMRKYAAFHAAPEVDHAGMALENAMRFALEVDQLPEPRFGGPLC
jgi:hypothetical protein